VNAFRDNVNFSASPNGDHIGAVFGPTLMGVRRRGARQAAQHRGAGIRRPEAQALLPTITRNTMALIEKFTETHARRIAETRGRRRRDRHRRRLRHPAAAPTSSSTCWTCRQEAHEMFHEWYPAMMKRINGRAGPAHQGQAGQCEYHAYLDRSSRRAAAIPATTCSRARVVAEVGRRG